MPESFRTDDELVSAVLDGEATADERARVAADPALSVRLAEFAAVADALRAPATPPSADARDAAIAAAVAEGRRPAQVVVALRPRRSTGSFLAVAAAVLVVLLFAGFLVGQVGDRNETEDSASEAGDDSGSDRVAEAGGATASDEATVEPGTDDTTASFGESAPIELGAVADEAALREALVASEALDALGVSPTTRSTLLPPTTTAPQDGDAVSGGTEACLVRLEESNPALDGVLLEGTAAYAGTEAVVYVFATVDGDTRVEVVTADTCEILVSFPL